jgi:hypothetical protein
LDQQKIGLSHKEKVKSNQTNYPSMKAKLILSTETKDTEQWADLPFIPRKDEWFNIPDILKADEIKEIEKSARCWSGEHGIVQSIEYRHDNSDFYTEIYIWCED